MYLIILLSIWHSEFQRKVLFLLADIRAKLCEVGRNYEPADSQFHLDTMENLEEFMAVEEQLKEAEKRQLMVSNYVEFHRHSYPFKSVLSS